MLRQGFILLSKSSLARAFVTHAPFASAAARRFVAGETIDDAVRAARELNEAGMTVTMDYLGESVSDRAEATAAADQYLEIIDRIVADGIDGNVSLKLTQMGQDIDEDFLHGNVGRVLDRAGQSRHVRPLRHGVQRLRPAHPGLLRPSLGRRPPQHGRRLPVHAPPHRDRRLWANERGIRVRLCKGAYAEPATVAFPEKKDVDASFVRCTHLLLEHGTYPGIATHDERMIEATKAFAREQGISPDRFEFQMLYGVRRDLQRQLVEEGWRVRIYIGFGTAWYPYFMRRLAERPANVASSRVSSPRQEGERPTVRRVAGGLGSASQMARSARKGAAVRRALLRGEAEPSCAAPRRPSGVTPRMRVTEIFHSIQGESTWAARP
jgi:proline dehydrogenase